MLVLTTIEGNALMYAKENSLPFTLYYFLLALGSTISITIRCYLCKYVIFDNTTPPGPPCNMVSCPIQTLPRALLRQEAPSYIKIGIH